MKPAGDQFRHSYALTILEGHLDTFGHVNHATYLQLMEEARWDLITERGFGLKEIQKSGHGPVILETRVEFKREIFLRQAIVIETELRALNRKIATIAQVVKCEGKICVSAEFKIGLFDMKKRRLMSPTAPWLHAIAADESGYPAKDIS